MASGAGQEAPSHFPPPPAPGDLCLPPCSPGSVWLAAPGSPHGHTFHFLLEKPSPSILKIPAKWKWLRDKLSETRDLTQDMKEMH